MKKPSYKQMAIGLGIATVLTFGGAKLAAKHLANGTSCPATGMKATTVAHTSDLFGQRVDVACCGCCEGKPLTQMGPVGVGIVALDVLTLAFGACASAFGAAAVVNGRKPQPQVELA